MSATDPHQVFHRTIEGVWRIESARDIAGHTRLTRDLDPAEDLGRNLQGSPVLGVNDTVEHLTSFVVPVQQWSDGAEYREDSVAEHHP